MQVRRDAFFSPRTFRDFCPSAAGAAINRAYARLVGDRRLNVARVWKFMQRFIINAALKDERLYF